VAVAQASNANPEKEPVMASEADEPGVTVEPAPSGNEQQVIDVYVNRDEGYAIGVGEPGQDAGTTTQDGSVTRLDFGDGDASPDDTTIITHDDDGGGDSGGSDDGGGDDGGGDDGGGDDPGPHGGDE
jgi:hypothetical protein